MFRAAKPVGGLNVQLVYYSGQSECPMAHTGRMGQSQIGKVLEHAHRREHARESHRQYCLLRLYICPARAFMMLARIAATAARHTSASSNGLPRSRSATACRYMSRRVRGTWCAWVMTWSSCASVNAIGAIGLGCGSNARIGGGLRQLADRLRTAAALRTPFPDARGRGPIPPGARPPCLPCPPPSIAGAATQNRLI